MPTRQKPAASDKRVHIPYPGNANFPFSSAVIVGPTVYLSGHLGLDPATHSIPADLDTEIKLLMDNFRETIVRSGATIEDLVYVQVFCSDVSLFDRFNAVYTTYFKLPLPARAFLGSGALLFGAHFEIQGIAVKNSDS
jgi:2-iminobutanoate/2-iminopropanoate deaminase